MIGQLNLNKMLDREDNYKKIKEVLNEFESNKNNLLFKRGIYIYGEPGIGKTTFAVNVLKDLGYDVIKYDAGDIRNKSIIETITKHTMSDKNIMSLFHKKVKKIAIVMDEIDGMNNGDKGGINTLIKLIRPKKTKKQKLEEITMNPIICIGNYHIYKKIKELMKVCNTIEIKTPNKKQIGDIINKIIPDIDNIHKNQIIKIVDGDLRKLNNICDIYKNNKNILNNDTFYETFQKKSYNDDTKKIIEKMFNNNYSLDEHLTIMNETDRTSVGLLWHENIIDILEKSECKASIPFYLKLLDNMCFADYIDRITFQKQIWQFNEMSSLIKTFKNNKLFHENFNKVNDTGKNTKYNPSEVRFTKVLTKYSTEYNNYTFIQTLCQKLGMDKKDIFTFFLDLKEKYDDSELVGLFENYEISKLDINRIYRYLEKYTTENAKDLDEIVIDCEEDIDETCCDEE